MRLGKIINILVKRRLKGMLECRGTNLSNLSKEMKKSHTYLSSTLGSDSAINLEVIFEIAIKLQCTMSELLPSEDEIESAIKQTKGVKDEK